MQFWKQISGMFSMLIECKKEKLRWVLRCSGMLCRIDWQFRHQSFWITYRFPSSRKSVLRKISEVLISHLHSDVSPKLFMVLTSSRKTCKRHPLRKEESCLSRYLNWWWTKSLQRITSDMEGTVNVNSQLFLRTLVNSSSPTREPVDFITFSATEFNSLQGEIRE